MEVHNNPRSHQLKDLTLREVSYSLLLEITSNIGAVSPSVAEIIAADTLEAEQSYLYLRLSLLAITY